MWPLRPTQFCPSHFCSLTSYPAPPILYSRHADLLHSPGHLHELPSLPPMLLAWLTPSQHSGLCQTSPAVYTIQYCPPMPQSLSVPFPWFIFPHSTYLKLQYLFLAFLMICLSHCNVASLIKGNMFPQCPEQHLAQRKCSINICKINE